MSVSQVRSLVFYTGFAFLVAHELDAMAQEEWRLLPLFDLLRDRTDYIVTLHMPLLAGLMWSPEIPWRLGTIGPAGHAARAEYRLWWTGLDVVGRNLRV